MSAGRRRRKAAVCRRLAATLLVSTLAGGVLPGCATQGGGGGTMAAEGDLHGAPSDSPIGVYDPLEGLNRNIYAFNAAIDELVLLPVVDAYTFIVPLVFRDRITDFFANIDDVITFGNQVLQLKFAEAFKTALRFGANTVFGMAGFVDIATPMGLPKYDEDFGQTLGFWGVGAGPYLVLPVLGPSNVRDAAGLAADAAALWAISPLGVDPVSLDNPAITALDVVNTRYVQPFRYYETNSPFEYDLVRFLYMKKREVEIGEPSWPDWRLPDPPAPPPPPMEDTRP